MKRKGITPVCLKFQDLSAKVGFKPVIYFGNLSLLEELTSIIVRPIGMGSLEEIIFRMDMLRRLNRLGMPIINHPEAIEICVDKYRALTLLEEAGIPVPKTIVTENVREALKAFHELGGDVVVKPLFGSRGIGSVRVSDPDTAIRVFKAIAFQHGVIYIQEFIPHDLSDIRVLVLGGSPIASMRRFSYSWKKNVSLGGIPKPAKLSSEIEEMAVKASEVVGCKLVGVDILEGKNGCVVVEVNSQPGWKGLQSVTKFNIADKIVDFMLSEAKR